MRVLFILAAIACLGADAGALPSRLPATATGAKPLIEIAAKTGCECAMRARGDKQAQRRCWRDLETLKRRYKASEMAGACWPGPVSACFNTGPWDQPQRVDEFCVTESIGTPGGDVCTMTQAETIMTIYSAKGEAAARAAVVQMGAGQQVLAIAGASKGCGDEPTG